MIDLTNPIFTDANLAREYLESTRWADGPYCPHCGETEKFRALEGKSHRPGLYQCNSCRKQFTVTVGTVFERSKIPLNKWLAAFFMLTASKKGMSAHQIHRTLGITYKSAWFMCHRIREAMKDGNPGPMGGGGQTVEADETYIGNKTWQLKKGRWVGKSKYAVVTLVERQGRARSFYVDRLSAKAVREILFTNASRDSVLNTDESGLYKVAGRQYADHKWVMHTLPQYARGKTHTNTIEGYFSIFKRGMKGVYQHCGEQHLQRYLTEFDFRYSNRAALGVDDNARAILAIKGAAGKRLTYRRTGEAAHG